MRRLRNQSTAGVCALFRGAGVRDTETACADWVDRGVHSAAVRHHEEDLPSQSAELAAGVLYQALPG
eukprot:2271659-Rhodomonas_salina.1